MKRVTIPIQGKEMPLCFSLRVVKACGERFGGLDGMDAALSNRDGDAVNMLCQCIWLLGQMLDAGYRLDMANGQEALKPPSEETLLDLFGMDDMAELQANLMAAMANDRSRTVEAAPGKNGEAMPETPVG